MRQKLNNTFTFYFSRSSQIFLVVQETEAEIMKFTKEKMRSVLCDRAKI
ncbi:hypothetical protein [Pleurocapsa sp. CCALA 161]|nr:hypothetical protein [Pleurocapsa sp. CCALA 161]